jgi:Asp/Glu/hydantoin racemase
MAEPTYRFLMINAFSLPGEANYGMRPDHGPKEARLMNHADLAHLLADVDWELHDGALATHGNHPVETREEFAIVGVNRLRLVREACESGRYNAIVLLGGGDPGFEEAREIGRRHRIPVTSCAHAQMHIARMLGDRFCVLDISEAHNMQMAALVRRYGFAGNCASIRNVNFPLPRPVLPNDRPIAAEKAKADRGERSDMVEAAVAEAVDAIENDGAEVFILGCSAAYWLAPIVQHRLEEMGWEAPVLEGYRCAIEQAKTLVNLGLDVSGLAMPSDHPRRWRRKKFV